MGVTLYSALQRFQERWETKGGFSISEHWDTVAIFEHGKDYELMRWLYEYAEKGKPWVYNSKTGSINYGQFDYQNWPTEAEHCDNHYITDSNKFKEIKGKNSNMPYVCRAILAALNEVEKEDKVRVIWWQI